MFRHGDVVLWESRRVAQSPSIEPESCVGIVLQVVPHQDGFDDLVKVDFWSVEAESFQYDPEYVMCDHLTVIGNAGEWSRGVF